MWGSELFVTRYRNTPRRGGGQQYRGNQGRLVSSQYEDMVGSQVWTFGLPASAMVSGWRVLAPPGRKWHSS
jgi:hypothetical protein